MNRLFLITLLLLSCAYEMYAQDSFFNPFSFTYEIEYSSEFIDSVAFPSETKIEVKYDINKRLSTCSILYNGEQKYQGRVLDIKLGQNNQTFVLEKYFFNKYDACLLVVKDAGDISNQKIGMIYYANQNEDSASEKTCYCLLLKDVDETIIP